MTGVLLTFVAFVAAAIYITMWRKKGLAFTGFICKH